MSSGLVREEMKKFRLEQLESQEEGGFQFKFPLMDLLTPNKIIEGPKITLSNLKKIRNMFTSIQTGVAEGRSCQE